MTRLAGHTNSYHSYSLEEALAGIAAAGFQRVELSAVPGWTEHVRFDDDALRSRIERHGLTAVSVSAHSDLTTPAGLEHCLRAIRWAAEFGIPVVNTAVGGHESEDEDEDAFLASADAIADAAEQAGIVVALETHGGLMGSGERAARLIERIGRESIRVNYDTANVEYYAGVRAAEDLPRVVRYVASVHLKDDIGEAGEWNNPALGEGRVDFARVLAILDEAGYAGPLSVEIEFEGEPWPPRSEVDEAIRRSYAYLRSLGVA
jgi:L-ribulose-5-phosphate 3-epimerase